MRRRRLCNAAKTKRESSPCTACGHDLVNEDTYYENKSINDDDDYGDIGGSGGYKQNGNDNTWYS